MRFQYVAQNAKGTRSSGELSGDSVEHITEKLQKMNLKVLKVGEIKDKKPTPAQNGEIFTFTFTARDEKNQSAKGTIDAINTTEASRRLKHEFHLHDIYISSIESQKPPRSDLWLEIKSFLDWITVLYTTYYFFAFLMIRFDIRLNFLPPEFLEATTRSTLFFGAMLLFFVAFTLSELKRWWTLLHKVDTWPASIYVIIFPLSIGAMSMFLYSLRLGFGSWQDATLWPLLPLLLTLITARNLLKP